jgi:hypothetical protein
MEGTIMTLEELRTAIEKERGLAFSSMRHLATADEKMLTACGYRGKTNADAVLAVFKYYDEKIEKMIRKWEKENPV